MDLKPLMAAKSTLTDSGNITVPITTTQDILCFQFVSNQVFKPVKLDASVLLSIVIRASESSTNANVVLAYSLRAFTADGLTSLGTLASSFANTGTEFGTTAATRIFGSATTIALTATQLSEHWRLVLDIGAHAEAPAAAATYLMRAGCSAASDFALTSALTTDLNPWLELSFNLNATRFNNSQHPRVGSGMSVTEKTR
jgi:hypothetical protein